MTKLFDLLKVDVGYTVFVTHEVPKPRTHSEVFLMRIAA
jgi:hypothetical protein